MADFKDPTRGPGTYRKLRFLSNVCAYLIIFTAVLVLTGWFLDIDRLKSIRHDTVAMNPVTAICFLLAGCALYLLQTKRQAKGKRIANWLASGILAVGLIKLFSLLTNLAIPFDQVLFRGQLWQPGKQVMNSMAPNTAINFTLTGLALL